MHVHYARVEFLIQKIIVDTCVIATVESEAHSSSVSVVYIVHFNIAVVFWKAALVWNPSFEGLPSKILLLCENVLHTLCSHWSYALYSIHLLTMLRYYGSSY